MSKCRSAMKRAMVVVWKGERKKKGGKEVREANARLVSGVVKRTNAAIGER